MRRFESRLERLDDIERKLSQYPKGLSAGFLARYYGVNRSTISRDLGVLERRGTGLIQQGRLWRLDHRRSVYGAKFTPYELVSLYVAARLLSRYSDERNPHVIQALDKLADALRAHSPLVAAHISRAGAAVAEHPARPEYIQAFEVITQGWLQQRKVRLVYHSHSTGERTERTFAPYCIEPSGVGYACYAIGMDDLRGSIRTLKIERIHEACLTDERFELPETFPSREMLASAWGIMWSEEEDHEVQLRFTPRVVWRVKESTWHPSQQIQDLPDGSCLFTVRVGSLVEIRPWIRQWGADVEVLQPQELRQELADELRALAALYAAD